MTEPLHFGALTIRPAERKLWIDGVPHVPGARAFELLLYLIEHRDRVVPKSELLEKVWPGLVVEENNLTVQVSALRKLIGPAAVTNISGRGYRFALEPSSGSTAQELQIPEQPSIAVLPFLYLAGESAHEYLADAFAEDITTELTRFRSFFVISRNSSFTFKGRAVQARQVSRELGVRYVVEGSVRVSASRMRITAQLIDATTDVHVWAERYDGSLEDVFDIQDQVVRSVCAAIAQGVETHEVHALRAHPAHLGAYAAATRAFQLADEAYNTSHPALREQALALADTALAQDPRSQKALTTRVFAMWHGLFFSGAGDRERHIAEAMEVAERLIALDPADAVALQFKGILLHEALRSREALDCLRRAHLLNPNDVRVLGALGYSQVLNGLFDEAVPNLEMAIRTNPLDSQAWSPTALLSMAWFARKDYERAAHYARVSCGIAAKVVTPHVGLAVACVGLGDMDAAARSIRRALELNPAWVRERLLGGFPRVQSEDLKQRSCAFIRIALTHLDPDEIAHWQPLLSGPQS